MKKICFLILAHTNLLQLERLINTLEYKFFDIYVHFDAKFSQKGLRRSGATVLTKRIKCYWGDYSCVQATLNLMEKARSSQNNYKYYSLLSGMDYPVKSNSFIYDRLMRSDREYIDFFESIDKHRLDRFQKMFFMKNTISHRYLRQISKYMSIKDRVLPSGYTPYFGSQWWSLSEQAVEYIFDVLHKNPNVSKFYYHSLLPDEMFFQTILCNSPFKDSIIPSLTHVDWSLGGKHPKVFTTDKDFDCLSNIDALFARKFDCNSNSEILNRIDKELR